MSLSSGWVFRSPLMHGIHDWFESQPKRGDLIFHFRRYFRIDRPFQETTFLHVPQLVREDFLRDSRNGALKIREPLHSLEQIPQQDNLPSAADEVGSQLCGTFKVLRHGGSRFTMRYPIGA